MSNFQGRRAWATLRPFIDKPFNKEKEALGFTSDSELINHILFERYYEEKKVFPTKKSDENNS